MGRGGKQGKEVGRSSLCPSAAFQVDVIKKAYLQEEECENAEVSPREVGHNIYILALQVRSGDSGVPATLGSPCRAGLPAWLGNGLFGPCEKPPPRLAVLLPWAPHVPLPCAPVAARQPGLTRPSLSLFQLSRHNKSLQQLLKPVKRIQEEEEEGISSMVRRGLGNGGKAPLSRPDPDRRLQRVSHPCWTTLGFAV